MGKSILADLGSPEDLYEISITTIGKNADKLLLSNLYPNVFADDHIKRQLTASYGEDKSILKIRACCC